MGNPIIRVENLGKVYQLKHQKTERHTTLRDAISSVSQSLLKRSSHIRQSEMSPDLEQFWALKDVSFEVNAGDRVGIIGRNGAGKSTLLKILSRITEPSLGSIRIRGRIASLLEVGTGFHPELTGRENIFLNGALLGMSKAEIHRKFDEIVAFAEVEKFLDTPVKRYSSGMYVRLAFAVAAHLEPEILIIDEVLAVGDADFQQKCLGKMEKIATEENRTILFVSHNMQAVQALCNKAYQLHKGEIIHSGTPETVISNYLSSISQLESKVSWSYEQAPGNDEARLLAVRVYTKDETVENSVFSSREDLFVEISFVVEKTSKALCVGFDLMTLDGITLFRSYQADSSEDELPPLFKGLNRYQCRIPAALLNAGTFYVCPRIGIHNLYWIVHIDAVIKFEIILDHGISPLWNSFDSKNHRPGIISPILNWKQLA